VDNARGGRDYSSEVIELWEDVLGAEVTSDSDFFELGGHSLIAVEIVGRTSDLVGYLIPISVVFENPTLEGFVDAVTSMKAEAAL